MPRHNQALSNFGLGKLLLKLGITNNTQQANQIGNLLLLVIVVILFGAIYVLNFGSSQTMVEDKYYYDPTLTDDAG